MNFHGYGRTMDDIASWFAPDSDNQRRLLAAILAFGLPAVADDLFL